jgi:hypothetical protein
MVMPKQYEQQGTRMGYWTWLLIVEVLALCWPAFLNNGHALIFPDTHVYFNAGRGAVDKLTAMLMKHRSGGTGGGGSVDVALQTARTVRSAFYSLFTFAIAVSGSLWVAIILQGLMVSAVLHFLLRFVSPGAPTRASWFVIALAACTSLSWLVSTMMPDVFTPVTVILATLVLIYFDRFTRTECWIVFFALSASLVMHLTNPLITVGILVVAGLIRRRRVWQDRQKYAFVIGAVAMALFATLIASVVGFKQWTLTPHQAPFLLAHSIYDGPAKLYLREHCPQVGFAMCRHLDRLDVSVNDFVWEENGVYSVVSLDEAAQIRREEKRIFINATLEYPFLAAIMTLRDGLEQLGYFSLEDFYIPSYAYVTPNPVVEENLPAKIERRYEYSGGSKLEMVLYIRPAEPLWEMVLAGPEYGVVIFALGYGIFVLARRAVDRNVRDFFILMVAAAFLNAMVVAFSDLSARYEARVIWLVPMAALALRYHLQPYPVDQAQSVEKVG